MTNGSGREHPSLAALRDALAHRQGKTYWRSLEELADTEEFRRFLNDEFPQHADGGGDGFSRRRMFQIMGASLALAGLAGCTKQPPEKIVPYVDPPEEVIPGKPLFFATAMPLNGYGLGLVVESHMGRPTKIEGNPGHPASLGATDTFAQASVLDLYDPDRSQVVTRFGNISTWPAFLSAIRSDLEEQKVRAGAGLRFLTGTVTSPTLISQMDAVLKQFPQAKWHVFEPAVGQNAQEGTRLAFGEPVHAVYRFDQAEVVLSLDADFVAHGPGNVRYAHDFISKRLLREGARAMNRLYAAESSPSCTGAVADHRLALRPSQIQALAAAIASGAGAAGWQGGGALEGAQAQWAQAVARDLQQHRGTSLVVAGAQQPAPVHALVHAINEALGNAGKTVYYTEPIEAQGHSIEELAADMRAGSVDLLFVLGSNPVYSAPADLEFPVQMGKVKTRVHLGLHRDETARYCHWHIPEVHYLESWGDVRAYDGTVSLLQPLISPLYDGRSAYELLAEVTGQSGRNAHDIVRAYWNTQHKTADFEAFWRKSLHDGVVAETALPQKKVAVRKDFTAGAAAQEKGGLELQFLPDPTIWDGRFANNAWLQELPKPLTKHTWDNAAMVSPATAESLGVNNEDVVELRSRGRSVTAPVWVMPGQADQCVTVTLGYGRTHVGPVGNGVGFNAYTLRTSDQPWSAGGLEIRKTGRHYAIAEAQRHFSMEGRELVRAGTLTEYRDHPAFAQSREPEQAAKLSLYPNHPYPGYAWGMAIDLTACTGCSACVVACQAENNIPVVGKEEVARAREMHWIRIDTYYSGSLETPVIDFEPIPCMQCENAPCELVCPVDATVHSPEGLNEMIYNRCVGTRYCSNNCPYKVRRFNFFQFVDQTTPSLKLQRNPDVTVRSRGVMEKCTYCVQRINEARIEAEKQERTLRDGEVVTACQQACPTRAIVFGNINDGNSRVAQLKATPLNYGLLTELTTRPRTTYLAKVRNPNPEI